MKHKRHLLFLLLLVSGFGLILSSSSPGATRGNTLPPLPKMWQIVWADDVSVTRLLTSKNLGYDGAFKCVAYAPNYPNAPIYAGGEWRLVERVEGQYDWSSLQTCLDNALQANLWFIPEIVINIPPEWFIQRYPDSLLQDSRGITATDIQAEGAPYLLSPWFIAGGEADAYLQPFVTAFLDLVAQYPNVPAVMIGNFKLNVLPWKMGTNDSDNFTYWPIWDEYAKTSFAGAFGGGVLPPATWDDYQAMSETEKAAFRDWLTSALETNLQTRYLPWVADFAGWKVINASIWDNDGVRPSIFTTSTPEMVAAKQAAMLAAAASGVIINDDNMGDCGLQQFQQQDVILAHANGFLILGERVPDTCSWENMFLMWQALDPKPDGFINIGAADASWTAQFRTLYGAPSEPFLELFLPLVFR